MKMAAINRYSNILKSWSVEVPNAPYSNRYRKLMKVLITGISGLLGGMVARDAYMTGYKVHSMHCRILIKFAIVDTMAQSQQLYVVPMLFCGRYK